MSLLTLIREHAIVANVAAGGEAYRVVTEAMREDAISGCSQGGYFVKDYPIEERNGTLNALKLQGFNTHFTDESQGTIWVSWLPKHPR